MKIFIRTVSIILGLIAAALAFVFIAPGYDLYFIRSESMKPAINIGDMMIAGPVSTNSITPGVIISYELGSTLITHRVLSVNDNTLITKGDANENPDPSPVQFSQVKSRYLFKIPYIGYLTGFLRTRPGWFLTIILPAIVLIGFMVKDIIKEVLKNDKPVSKMAKRRLNRKSLNRNN